MNDCKWDFISNTKYNSKKSTKETRTNNQELLIRKQYESDATSRWIEFQKTSLSWE